MFADSSTRSGARSIGLRGQRHVVVERLLEHVGERRRLIEVARLREIPRHELDVARAAAEGRHALAAAGRRLRRVAIERRDEDRRAVTSPAAARRWRAG